MMDDLSCFSMGIEKEEHIEFMKWFYNEVYLKICPKLNELKEIGLDLGESAEVLDQEMQQMKDGAEHIFLCLLDRQLQQKATRRRVILEEAESYGLNLIELGRILDVPNIEPDETLKVIPLRDYLKSRVSELELIRNERLTRLEHLRSEEKKIADFLGEFPLKIASSVLTLKTLDDVQRNVEKLQNEKLKRKELFGTMRGKILLLMNALEHNADTSLEMDIVSADEDTFYLTEVNMNATKALLEKFERECNMNEAEAKKLRESLQFLWSFLHVETNDQDSFLNEHDGYRPSTLRALRDELKRCKELKMKNARHYLDKVRSEITDMWDRCYFSASQRKAFKAFTCDDYTEDLIEIHDAELQRLKNIRDEGEPLFVKFEKRAELWTRMQQLERQAFDPKRLMNRGGQLLKEEKERKKLQALIPKLEADLEANVFKWEEEKGRRFLVYGKQVMEFIRDQWDIYQQGKENEKLARHVAKARQLEDEMVNGSRVNTSKRRIVGTPTREPRNKLPKLTPLTCNAVITRAASSASKTIRKPPVAASKSTVRKLRPTSRRSQYQVRRKLECTQASGTSNHKSVCGDSTILGTGTNCPTTSSLVTPNVSSYSQFTKHIDQRCQTDTHSRSSVLLPRSPGTPRRYRDRLGLPFLL